MKELIEFTLQDLSSAIQSFTSSNEPLVLGLALLALVLTVWAAAKGKL